MSIARISGVHTGEVEGKTASLMMYVANGDEVLWVRNLPVAVAAALVNMVQDDRGFRLSWKEHGVVRCYAAASGFIRYAYMGVGE